MRFEQLRYVEAAARHGSLRKAADELRISQPSLSQQIQRLEEDLGVILFVRRPNGVRATDAANTLMDHIRSALRLEDVMRQDASAIGGVRTGQVDLGAVPTVCRALLPSCIRSFRLKHPNIRFRIREGGSGKLREALVRGELDLAVVSAFVDDELPELLISDLMVDPLVACMPKGHRLAKKASITGSDLEGEPMIMHDRGYILSRAYERLSVGHNLNPVVDAESTDTAREFVSAEIGIAIMPRLAVVTGNVDRQRIVTAPLEAPWARLRVVVIRRGDERPAPASQTVVRLLRAAAANVAEA